jgi:hypothetical protein
MSNFQQKLEEVMILSRIDYLKEESNLIQRQIDKYFLENITYDNLLCDPTIETSQKENINSQLVKTSAQKHLLEETLGNLITELDDLNGEVIAPSLSGYEPSERNPRGASKKSYPKAQGTLKEIPLCQFIGKPGGCKFGFNCRNLHPKTAVHCKFNGKPGGCKDKTCTFLHKKTITDKCWFFFKDPNGCTKQDCAFSHTC